MVGFDDGRAETQPPGGCVETDVLWVGSGTSAGGPTTGPTTPEEALMSALRAILPRSA